LLQYGDASRYQYLEIILSNLERIEKVIKQAERSIEFGCAVTGCRLLNFGLDIFRLSENRIQILKYTENIRNEMIEFYFLLKWIQWDFITLIYYRIYV